MKHWRRPFNGLLPVRATIRETAKGAAARIGYDVHRRDHSHPARRAAALAASGVNVVIDVGANEGQYVRQLHEFGFTGFVTSFEPSKETFAALQARFSAHQGWTGLNLAVGERTGAVELHVAKSSLTSSLLQANENLRSRIAAAAAEATVSVPMVALDDIWSDLVVATDQPMLKIDVQGYEHRVLDGAVGALASVRLLEVEMALIPLYEGGSTLYDLLPRLHRAGFQVISIDSGFVDVSTGQVLDVDVLLGRP